MAKCPCILTDVTNVAMNSSYCCPCILILQISNAPPADKKGWSEFFLLSVLAWARVAVPVLAAVAVVVLEGL